MRSKWIWMSFYLIITTSFYYIASFDIATAAYHNHNSRLSLHPVPSTALIHHAFEITELITDGGFEAGTSSAAWAQMSTTSAPIVCDGACSYDNIPQSFRGDYWAAFQGSFSQLEEASLQQDVTVLPNTVVMTATLSFWLRIPEGSSEQDTFTVSIDDAELFTVTGSDGNNYRNYSRIEMDVTDVISNTHTLRFGAAIQSRSFTSFHLDNVSLMLEGREQLEQTDTSLYLPLFVQPTTADN